MSKEIEHKPPLGAMPAWIGAARRIKELAEAISRTAETYSGSGEYRMKNWAKEIIIQCDILSDFPPGTEQDIPIPNVLFNAFNKTENER